MAGAKWFVVWALERLCALGDVTRINGWTWGCKLANWSFRLETRESNMFPFWFYAITVLFFGTAIAGGTALVVSIARSLWAEQQDPVPDWDQAATMELFLWRQEQAKDKARCPHCKGTRCWDWRRNGRSCEINPTLADLKPDLTEGRHYGHTVQLAAPGWWPLPRTLAGRLHPHLWSRVADHCQIALTRPMGMVLP